MMAISCGQKGDGGSNAFELTLRSSNLQSCPHAIAAEVSLVNAIGIDIVEWQTLQRSVV